MKAQRCRKKFMLMIAVVLIAEMLLIPLKASAQEKFWVMVTVAREDRDKGEVKLWEDTGVNFGNWYYPGKDVTFTAIPFKDYVFSHWELITYAEGSDTDRLEEVCYDNPYRFTTQDYICGIAYFAPAFKINVSYWDESEYKAERVNGTVTAKGIRTGVNRNNVEYKAAANAEVTLDLTPDDGCILKDLKILVKNGDTYEEITPSTTGSNKVEFTMPEQDVEIRVKYDQPRVGVATNGRTNKKGTVKIEDDISGVDFAGLFDCGSRLTISAEPADGYAFEGWRVGKTYQEALRNGVSIGYAKRNPYEFTVEKDEYYVAEFVKGYSIALGEHYGDIGWVVDHEDSVTDSRFIGLEGDLVRLTSYQNEGEDAEGNQYRLTGIKYQYTLNGNTVTEDFSDSFTMPAADVTILPQYAKMYQMTLEATETCPDNDDSTLEAWHDNFSNTLSFYSMRHYPDRTYYQAPGDIVKVEVNLSSREHAEVHVKSADGTKEVPAVQNAREHRWEFEMPDYPVVISADIDVLTNDELYMVYPKSGQDPANGTIRSYIGSQSGRYAAGDKVYLWPDASYGCRLQEGSLQLEDEYGTPVVIEEIDPYEGEEGFIITMPASNVYYSAVFEAVPEETEASADDENADPEVEEPAGDETPEGEEPAGDETPEGEEPAGDEAAAEEEPAGDETPEGEEPAGDEAAAEEEPAGDETPEGEKPAGDKAAAEEEPAGDEAAAEEEPAGDVIPAEESQEEDASLTGSTFSSGGLIAVIIAAAALIGAGAFFWLRKRKKETGK